MWNLKFDCAKSRKLAVNSKSLAFHHYWFYSLLHLFISNKPSEHVNYSQWICSGVVASPYFCAEQTGNNMWSTSPQRWHKCTWVCSALSLFSLESATTWRTRGVCRSGLNMYGVCAWVFCWFMRMSNYCICVCECVVLRGAFLISAQSLPPKIRATCRFGEPL